MGNDRNGIERTSFDHLDSNYGANQSSGSNNSGGKGGSSGNTSNRGGHKDIFSIDNNGSRNQSPKPIVLFSNQSKQPELSYDHHGLRLAIKNGNIQEVENILKVDSKLGRYVDSVSRQSMLHLACIFSHSNIAMLLLDIGADPELKNAHGETAFDLAPPALAQKMIKFIEDWEEAENTSDSD